MYTPAHLRATTDMSEFYERAPHEMSRYELQELENIIRLAETDEMGDDSDDESFADSIDENGNLVTKLDKFRATDGFKEAAAEVRKIQPMRIGIFKRYWDKFKFNKKRREKLVEMFDETDK